MYINKKITPYNRTVMTGRRIEYIVIHYVGAVSTAKNNADYYANNKLQASAHYFVDETSIWQSVEDKDRAWHCGGGLQGSGGHRFFQMCTNSNSIGIEMCCKQTSTGTWYFEEATVKNTVELVKLLMQKYNVPIDKVIRHYDVTGKMCPMPYINEGIWADFKSKILKEERPMFKDVSEKDYAYKHIKKLKDYGVVNGDENGNFNPDQPITRRDAAVMIANALAVAGK